MFSGGALSRFTVFALGIMPYISASIIMQLMTYVVPTFEQLKKEGESGRRKITRSEEHTSELQSQSNLVCRLLLEKKKKHQDSHSVKIHMQMYLGHFNSI